MQFVNAKLHLRKLIRKGVITDTIKGEIENASDDDSREVLFAHLKHNTDVDTLKKYLKVAIAASRYPNMQSLGRKMKEELKQGGRLELCALCRGCNVYVHACVHVCACGTWQFYLHNMTPCVVSAHSSVFPWQRM